jgi:hypothetical protein
MILSTRGSFDGEAHVNLLKKIEKQVRSGQLKVLMISSVKKHPLAANFSALGVTDYAEEPVPVRSLSFKMNRLINAVLNLRKVAGVGEENFVIKAGGLSGSPAAESASPDVPLRYKPALELAEDTFVFRNTSPRKIGKKFVLQADGPAPETGDWIAEKKKSARGATQWRWVPKDKSAVSPPTGAEDGWLHEGDRPTFDERTQNWQLRSETPHLYFRKKGLEIGAKVETDDQGNLSIAADSEAALANLTLNKKSALQVKIQAATRSHIATTPAERTIRLSDASSEEEESTPRELKSGPESAKKSKTQWNDSRGKEEGASHHSETLARAAELEKNIAKQRPDTDEKAGTLNALKGKQDSPAAPIGQIRIKRESEKKDELEATSSTDLPEGLSKTDLEGKQNLRDRWGRTIEKKIAHDELPTGLDRDQLESEGNLRDAPLRKELQLKLAREKKLGRQNKPLFSVEGEPSSDPSAAAEDAAQEAATQRIGRTPRKGAAATHSCRSASDGENEPVRDTNVRAAYRSGTDLSRPGPPSQGRSPARLLARARRAQKKSPGRRKSLASRKRRRNFGRTRTRNGEESQAISGHRFDR